MITDQRDSRRQRHIHSVKECEKFLEQFYENFKEKSNAIKDNVSVFLEASDEEVKATLDQMNDQTLLANEIDFVNGCWEKISSHFSARSEHSDHTLHEIKELQDFQMNNSGKYWDKLQQELTHHAFLLEPDVISLVNEWKAKEELRYEKEHSESYKFHENLVAKEKASFEKAKDDWEQKRIRFHILKQENAIKTFQDRINSPEFVNPEERIALFARLKKTQLEVFDKRMNEIKRIDNTQTVEITVKKIDDITGKLELINDEAQEDYDKIASHLTQSINDSNSHMESLLEELRSFLNANQAKIDEDTTYDKIIEEQATPYVERRKLESSEIFAKSFGYLEKTDDEMNEICKNIMEFLKKLATKYDKGKEDLKKSKFDFDVRLAQCNDERDNQIDDLEDELSKKVDQMSKAIHHKELNEKLNECFEQLDVITRSHRDFNKKYIDIVDARPSELQEFYEKFERNCAEVFEFYHEDKREEIQEIFQKETEERQRKLEEEALKKFEEEKRQEELKAQKEEKSNPKGKKAPPKPAKKGKEPDKPDLGLPQLEVPEVQEMTSTNGFKYLVKRTPDEIATQLMHIKAEETEDDNKEGEGEGEAEQEEAKETPPEPEEEKNQEGEGEGEGDEEKEPKEVPNPYLENINKIPPCDPDGNKILEEDLVIKHPEIKKIVGNFTEKMFAWINENKKEMIKKMVFENRELLLENNDDLDEKLKFLLPRKGKLEVEVYQERKSQITAHNKKYERQIRTCLEKHNKAEEMWEYLTEVVNRDFESYDKQQDKIKGNIPDCKNLAELQGTSRRERDSCQSFEEKITEITDKLTDLALAHADNAIKLNDDMLKSCILFDKGGNYSELEVKWYEEQMGEINEMLISFRNEKEKELFEIKEKLQQRLSDTYENFEGEYKSGMHNLVAKEGLGKKFGAPRRIIQERMRAEMAKCEQAQSGIEKLLDKLGQLCSGDWIGDQATDSLSIEIRKVQICILRCIVRYAKHLKSVNEGVNDIKDLEEVPDISLDEHHMTLDLTEEEEKTIGERKEDELKHLGLIGTEKEEIKTFGQMVQEINTIAIEHCQKLYEGEDAQWLVGDKKIPEYLSIYLVGVNAQAEEFRVKSIRYLKDASAEYTKLSEKIPVTIFSYIEEKYTNKITSSIQTLEREYTTYEKEDKELRAKHLRRFRPNLANPANAQELDDLNTEAKERTEKFMDIVDDTQVKLVDLEIDLSNEFYVVYLNNLRAMLKLHIELPRDEVVVKKKLNIKVLTAKYQGKDLLTQPKRKWKGLGPNPFKVDLTKYDTFADYVNPDKEEDKEEPEKGKKDPPKKGEVEVPEINEIEEEVEIKNTLYHKSIIKSRNENYLKFADRFKTSFDRIMAKYDDIREEEENFNEYWDKNLAELKSKHI